ncbi:unnamed protein product [Didymodactylos carnosus]|uniref:Uncharacterized protein n=1 Tax=Didymodactylos carnosus TaxID=1234261 RepID=A0A8S2H932_9BILA|nr:unnamed protein product [Didymodactylos carnosus]CAF3592853.1 unnamed protein product [Didymodactylos carnosus]
MAMLYDLSPLRCGRARYDGVMYEMYQDHICQAPDPNEIEKAVFSHEIRQKAEQCHDPPRLIIQEARLKLFSGAAATIPQYTASQRAIQRIRQDKDIPTEPKTFAAIVIPPNFQITVTNQQFLLYDNNNHHQRLLIFASTEQLDLLNGCESWHCDGTFTELRLRKEFLENADSRHTMKNLVALAFVPQQNVIQEFTQIK